MTKKKELTQGEKDDNLIIDLLLKKGMKNAEDITNTFNQMYGKIVQRLLDEEFNEFMKYDKGSHEKKTNENRRNGVTSKGKKVKTGNGEIVIVPPRDREGKFEPQIVKKRQKVLDGLDNIIITMYAKGNTLKDIKELLQQIYSIELSEEAISNRTAAVNEEVEKWQNRQLQKCYPFVYVDCLYCSVKEDLRSIKKAIYVVLGVNISGIKDVLGVWISEQESASKWCEIFEELKQRGVEDIFFVSMDGLSGLPDAVEKVFPQAIMQRCIVHIVRNLYSVLPKKESKAVIADFKKIYTTSSLSNAKLEYENFRKKYKDNKKIMNKVDSNIEWIYQLFEYPKAIRKVIYTTNAIESLNSVYRRLNQQRSVFPSDTALLKALYLLTFEATKKWTASIRNWAQVYGELSIMYEGRLPE